MITVAIHCSTSDYPGLISDCLITERIIPACRPKLPRAGHPLRTPQELHHYTLLHKRWATENRSPTKWAAWLKAAGVIHAHPIAGIHFNQNTLLLEAAVEGQGVALEDAHIAEKDIQKGRVMRLFPERFNKASHFCYYLVYPPDHLDYPKVAAFRDWIPNEVGGA